MRWARFVRFETGDPSILELPCVTNLVVRALSSLFPSISSRSPRTSPSLFPLWIIPPWSLLDILLRFPLGYPRRCLNILRCLIFHFLPRRCSGNYGSPRRFEYLEKFNGIKMERVRRREWSSFFFYQQWICTPFIYIKI